MAGDWIKMRHALETDPDVIRVADLVGVDRFAVVGRLHAIWSWADQHSVDGHAVSVTTSFLDSHVSLDGFCDALRRVGWLEGRDWDLTFPNFDRHNGKTAKTRATNAKRKEVSRNGHESVTKMSRSERDKSATREEKRREEKSSSKKKQAKRMFAAEDVTWPTGMETDASSQSLVEWLSYKKSRKEPYASVESVNKLLVMFHNRHGDDAAAAFSEAVDNSIANNWAGCHEPKTDGSRRAQPRALGPSLADQLPITDGSDK